MELPVFTLTNVGLSKKGKTLLQGIDATVQTGELLVLYGPSGSGKSTLLRLLNRLEDPTQGTILFRGRPLSEYDPCQLRQQVALVFQTPVFFPGTLLENLQRVDTLNNRPIRPLQEYAARIEGMGLPTSLLEQEATTMSLGEKQRAALARTMLNDPQVLLLDEPTSALDETNRHHLLRVIETLSKAGTTVIMVNHQTDEAFPLATRRWHMIDGILTEESEAPR